MKITIKNANKKDWETLCLLVDNVDEWFNKNMQSTINDNDFICDCISETLDKLEKLKTMIPTKIYDIIILKNEIKHLEEEFEYAPLDMLISNMHNKFNFKEDKTNQIIENITKKGQVYEPSKGKLKLV